MITVAYAPADAALGAQIERDLAQAGWQLSETIQRGSERVSDSLLVVLISPQSKTEVEPKIIEALDQHIHILPVLLGSVTLPKLINNLLPLDFSEGRYSFEALQAAITALTSPDAPRPMMALTPAKRRANQQAGLILAIPVLVMFAAGIYLVGVLGVQFPQADFDIQETARVEQRNTLIGPTLDAVLPKTTSDALAFETTVQALPTRLRDFAGATATSYILGTATPEPTWTTIPTR